MSGECIGVSMMPGDTAFTRIPRPAYSTARLLVAAAMPPFVSEASTDGTFDFGWSTSVVSPPDGDMTAYLESLTKLYEREQDTIYFPAHGPAVEKPRQLVRGMIGHRRSREKQILRQIEAGRLRIGEMVPHMYKGVDERLWPAAGRSVLAHLIDLERRGRVARSEDRWTILA